MKQITQQSCHHCHKLFTIKRNPKQIYCSAKACQNARKNAWRRKKLKRDDDYRANQKIASQKWRQRNRSYWRHYREKHPKYTERNRQQQKQRDELRNKRTSRILANSDALLQENDIFSGTYQLIPVNASHLANSDALTVEISLLSRG